MPSSGIPIDSNFKSASCQLGGLRLNGIVSQGTASSLNVIVIDDPASVQITAVPALLPNTFLQVKIAGVDYYLTLYQ